MCDGLLFRTISTVAFCLPPSHSESQFIIDQPEPNVQGVHPLLRAVAAACAAHTFNAQSSVLPSIPGTQPGPDAVAEQGSLSAAQRKACGDEQSPDISCVRRSLTLVEIQRHMSSIEVGCVCAHITKRYIDDDLGVTGPDMLPKLMATKLLGWLQNRVENSGPDCTFLHKHPSKHQSAASGMFLFPLNSNQTALPEHQWQYSAGTWVTCRCFGV